MSKKEVEKTDSAMGGTGLQERLRQIQLNQEQVNQKRASQDVPVENKPIQEPSLKTEEEQKNEFLGSPESTEQEIDSESELGFERGKMPPEARRVLVYLLKHGVILAAQKKTLFEIVCRYQPSIQNHLSDVYLKLVLDEKSGVAFVAQMDESEMEETDMVSLMTRRTLSLYDTLVLLVLRKHYQERESAGELRIIIDIERIEAYLTPFLPLTNSMKSDQRKISASLNKMVEKHLLSKVRGSEDRFEITPIIRYVVNAEFLEKMLETYQNLAHKEGGKEADDVALQSNDSVNLTESGSDRAPN
ncbi:MAG: DUF4194 domain-containing protein [Thiomicrorhabdus sp.]|nr:DUF4194 domain-containing protein [Thiomicrorhabdus sp.]